MRIIYWILIWLCCWQVSVAQTTMTVSGYVTDLRTGEALIGVSVFDTLSHQGTATNGYGFYSLVLPAGSRSIRFSYVGYQTGWLAIGGTTDQVLNMGLTSETQTLQQVVVEASPEAVVELQTFDKQNLTMDQVRKLPLFLAEPDVIKAVQLQPGIKTLGDGSSGMFVRGGSNDQNLILIDEAPIYNPSHMFGLVSVFNPQAVNSVQLYKSNMPARYGGRVAAVLDTKMKEGNKYDTELTATLSPMVSSLTINGPIREGKASYFASVRKSLIDLAVNPGASFFLVPGFYDLNLKINAPIGPKDRLYASYYQGEDQLRTAEGFSNDWGNRIGSLRWNRQWSAKLFTNLSLIYSDYDNQVLFQDSLRNYSWLTGVEDLHPKLDIYYYLNAQHSFEAGLGTIVHRFTPGQSDQPSTSLPEIRALEHAAYLQHDAQWSPKFGMQYGLRFSVFQNYGAYEWFEFDEQYRITGRASNEDGIYHTRWLLEPRMSLTYMPTPSQNLKLSYTRNAQYLQVLQNNALAYTSLETWLPTTPNTEPIIADAVASSWEYHKGENTVRLTGYYKWIQHQLDFVDHAQLTENPGIEAEIREGNGQAYGIEVETEQVTGPVSWQASYTWSRALRTVPDINNGLPYRAPFDIPHDGRVTGVYSINDRWEASANFVIMSGRPVTLPIGFFIDGDDRRPVPIYTERNGGRMPVYHRLDLGVSYTTLPRPDRPGTWSFGFSVFNAYGRKNPIGYAFRYDPQVRDVVPLQYILFRTLPSFSIRYNLTFK
ncbi:MAG: TonB-dependent receptor [Bacteroidota bacterium]